MLERRLVLLSLVVLLVRVLFSFLPFRVFVLSLATCEMSWTLRYLISKPALAAGRVDVQFSTRSG